MKDIRKILNLTRPYWGRIALAGMGSIVVSGMNGFLAWLAKPAVDKLFVEKKAEYLPFIALGCSLRIQSEESFLSSSLISCGLQAQRLLGI